MMMMVGVMMIMMRIYQKGFVHRSVNGTSCDDDDGNDDDGDEDISQEVSFTDL